MELKRILEKRHIMAVSAALLALTLAVSGCKTGSDAALKQNEGTEIPAEQETAEEQWITAERKLPLFSGATELGAGDPELCFADDEIFILQMCGGIVIMQYAKEEEPRLLDAIDLGSIRSGSAQGANNGFTRVSADGSEIYLHELDGDAVYCYNRKEGKLYKDDTWTQEDKALYRRPADMSGQMIVGIPVLEQDQGYFALKEGRKEEIYCVQDLLLVLHGKAYPVWTESLRQYMLELKRRLDAGDRTVENHNWEGGFWQPMQKLEDSGEGAAAGWDYRYGISRVDKEGNLLADETEWTSYFQKAGESARMPGQPFFRYIGSYRNCLIFRNPEDENLSVIGEGETKAASMATTKDGMVSVVCANQMAGICDNREKKLLFYDNELDRVKERENVLFAGYRDGFYFVQDLETGLYGCLDDWGGVTVPFEYEDAEYLQENAESLVQKGGTMHSRTDD